MRAEPLALLPELCLFAGAVAGLLAGLWLPRHRQWVVRLVAVAALLAALAATVSAMFDAPRLYYDLTFSVDVATNVARLVVAAATLLVVVMSADAVEGHPRETEFYVLALLGATGTLVLAGASDLLIVVIGYMLASFPLYALAGFGKDAPGTEAALKYYLMGALLNIVLLAGVVVLFGAGGATSYSELRATLGAGPAGVVALGAVALLVGLLFKAGGVPSHFWVPDVAEGATTPVAAFVTTVPKVGALVAAYRVLAEMLPDAAGRWPLLVAVLATASMTVGNLAAFFQEHPRRLLAYSTVSQVGYLLMAVAVAGRSDLALRTLLFYLGAYALTNLGAFAVAAEFPAARRLGDYAGMFDRERWLALTLVVCLLGLVGTPPTAVFVGKLGVFTAALDGGLAWLVVVAVANTVASLFYYLRWLSPMFLQPARRPVGEPAAAELQPAGRWSRWVAYTAGGGSLLLGVAGGAGLLVTTGSLAG
ncbi:MAG: NADH-quinone oxidoreductase subunit N [Actinomycetota bacterium]